MQSPPLDSRFAQPRTLCFVIGAQKAGTTWLQAHFAAHPEVCVPGVKELNYWNRVRFPFMPDARPAVGPSIAARLRGLIGTPKMRRKERARRRLGTMSQGSEDGTHRGYADVLFDSYAQQPVVAEVTPQYALLRADTFREMAALGTDVRFVFIMRDPLGRIHSRLNHKIGNGLPNEGDISPETIDAFYRGMLSTGADSDLIRRSSYDATLSELEAAVPTERIGLFFYEDFFKPKEQERLSRFLGITHVTAKVEKRVLKSKGAVRDFSAELDAQALEYLRPTYAYFADRFGDAVPDAWKRSMARLGVKPATVD